jgi:hypothetical protein
VVTSDNYERHNIVISVSDDVMAHHVMCEPREPFQNITPFLTTFHYFLSLFIQQRNNDLFKNWKLRPLVEGAAHLSIVGAFDEQVSHTIAITDRVQELCEGTIVADLIWLQIMAGTITYWHVLQFVKPINIVNNGT